MACVQLRVLSPNDPITVSIYRFSCVSKRTHDSPELFGTYQSLEGRLSRVHAQHRDLKLSALVSAPVEALEMLVETLAKESPECVDRAKVT